MADILKGKDLRVRSDEELASFVDEKIDELMKLRFQHATGQLENVARIKDVKKEIARAKTLVNERAQAAG